MQPVSQLDHKHAHVVAHGQNHLADVFRLGFFFVFKRNFADLGNAVNNVGYFFAEIFFNLLKGGFGVLHRIVQQTGDNGGFVKAHFGQGIGHGQGVGEVGLTRKAGLTRVGCGGKHIGLLDKLQIGVVVVGRHFVENFLDTDHA